MREGYRHELKYLISYPEYLSLKTRLNALMRPDPNAPAYMIRSLYFDDMYHSAEKEKEDGVEVRKKYRIRIYDYDLKTTKLECKHKFDSYIKKESVNLKPEEFEKILNGDVDFLLNHEHPMAREFALDTKCRLLKPRVNVDYYREVFVEDVGTTRITFDSHIACAKPDVVFDDGKAPSYELEPADQIVLEVKFNEILPEYVRSLLTVNNLCELAFSKYVMCCNRMKEELL